MSTEKPVVFIATYRSYQALTKTIYDYLTKQGFDVCYHFSDDIQVDYEATVKPHILASAIVLTTISPEGLQINHATNHYKLMLNTAIETGRVILPLMFFDDSWETDLIQEHLPEQWQVLTNFAAIHLDFANFDNTLIAIEARLQKMDSSQVDIEPTDEQLALASIELDDIDSALKAEGWYERGNRYFLNENYEEAKFHFSKAIDLNPKFVEAYNNRGIIYRRVGDSESALIDYEQAIKFKSGSLSVYLSNYGLSLYETGSLRKAVSANKKALEIDPKNSLAHNNLGLIYSNSNHNQKAIESFSASIEIDPDSDVLLVNRAIVYKNMGLNEKAVADYSRAYELKPDKHEYLRSRAKLYYAMDKVEKALIDFKSLLELQPDSAETYTYISRLYLSIHQHETALNYANKAIEVDPEYSPIYSLRSELHALMEDYEKALSDLNKLMELVPDSPVNYFNRGIYFSLVADYDNALNDLNHAIKLHPPYAEAYFQRYLVYLEMKHYYKALSDLNKAIILDDTKSKYFLRRGYLYIRIGNIKLAHKNFQIAYSIDPDDKTIIEALENVETLLDSPHSDGCWNLLFKLKMLNR